MDEQVTEPVAAYDRLAPEYSRISEARRPYLEAIEGLVIANVPAGAQSMLDVGAGDGRRAIRIAAAARIPNLTLLEPSPAMRSFWPPDVEAWPLKAEQLSHKSREFDVITCLWNVLGHLFPVESRLEMLRQVARLLSPDGRAFIDVSNRYNARHYGWPRTMARMAADLFRKEHGDVRPAWKLRDGDLVTKGHVFTNREFVTLARNAGLRIIASKSIDYANGRERKSLLEGHLFYVCGPDSIQPATAR